MYYKKRGSGGFEKLKPDRESKGINSKWYFIDGFLSSKDNWQLLIKILFCCNGHFNQ